MEKINFSLDCLLYKKPNTTSLKRVLILLHGYGSGAEDLISLVQFFQQLEDTLFIAAEAPEPCPIGLGKQWFPLNIKEVNNIIEIETPLISDIDIASKKIIQLIDEIEKAYNISSNSIGLFGFSQGGILSLYTALHTKKSLWAVVAHSGAYYISNHENTNNVQNILLLHGDMDNILPIKHLRQTEDYLDSLSIAYESHIEQSLEHSVNINTIAITENFLRKHQS